MASVHLRFWS